MVEFSTISLVKECSKEKFMKLSIITINYNNASGLQRTLDSVAAQATGNRSQDIGLEVEHVIVDGGSTDESVGAIHEYVSGVQDTGYRIQVLWISEKDKGVYNAMNKGINMATGDYIQILNSGDVLASDDVICKMKNVICEMKELPEILYGNMMKAFSDGRIFRDNCGGSGVGKSFLYFYTGTLNHDCAWVKRDLFEHIGLYNEEMRICSDWEWYIRAIVLGGVKPVYTDIDVTIFDMNGMSESGGKNKAIIQKERLEYLEKILPPSVLADYDKHAFDMIQMDKLREHKWAYNLVWILERVLNKIDKWRSK